MRKLTKKIAAVFMSMIMTCSLFACAEDEEDSAAVRSGDTEVDYSYLFEDDEQEEDGTDTADAADSSDRLSLSVDRSTGNLTVRRPVVKSDKTMGDKGVWTIFVYLCGTDLESDYGAATSDINEMLYGSENENVRYVIQTGGTKSWQNSEIESGSMARMLISEGEMTEVGSSSYSNMGSSDTLVDFLSWGVENYASEYMGVVFWDHGGGSISGVCFDELNDSDSLSLRELDTAFSSVYGNMTQKFDFVGFDACLMSTMETANIMASYADYLYASEEVEPGNGWDYYSIGSFINENGAVDPVSLGQKVSDSFYDSCAQTGEEDGATFAVIELDKIDEVLVAFNDYANKLYEAGSDPEVLTELVRRIVNAESFGSNNKTEGYTNMVDVAGLCEACSEYAGDAGSVRAAIDDAVAYKKNGSTHSNACGLSMYYPLEIQGSTELATFGDICVSPYYLSFIDRLNYGGVHGGDTESYSDDQWFDDEGEWSWDYDDSYEDYWSYVDDYEQTGESSLITFAENPQEDPESGYYWFQLDDNGLGYAASVSGIVYEINEDDNTMIEIGETLSINGDFEEGLFADDFDGYWLSLPDGQNLAIYVADETDDYTVYTSPILLNGTETNLRMRHYYDTGEVVVEGAWDGMDEWGASSREITRLKDGDVIVPVYYAYDLDSDDEYTYTGDEFVVSGEPEIDYALMTPGYYMYSFIIYDIFNDNYLTDPAAFSLSEDGEVSFIED